VLSPETNSFCLRHRRIEGFANPGWISQNLRRLDTSNGCQDHTALPSAAIAFVGARPSLTGIKPALRKPLARPRCRGHRSPHPTSVTIAIRPSCERGMADVVGLIWGKREAEYFSREGWTRCRARRKVICPSGSHTGDHTDCRWGNGPRSVLQASRACYGAIDGALRAACLEDGRSSLTLMV
jgi:hypothetical protein